MLSTIAEVNHGLWVARCPLCPCAEHLGGQGFRTEKSFECSECGAKAEVVWPPERHEIELALAPRPKANQNWIRGEPLAALLIENREHMMAVV